MSALEGARMIRLDVRPTLAAGGEPFSEILAAADALPVGGILELLAPFEPIPLYQVMRHRGFAHRTVPQPGGDHLVTFTSTGITPDQLLADIANRHPEVAPILARHGFDLCCGGAKPVELAARAHGVELEGLLDELQGGSTAVRSERELSGPDPGLNSEPGKRELPPGFSLSP